MSKHLIYMGFTGTAHRIGLFDTDDIVRKSIPIKDVPVLSDDLEFINCTVKNGVPYPNLHGAKVVCSVPDASNETIGFTPYDTHYDDYRHIPAKMKMQDFYAFKNKKPKFLYGWGTGKDDGLSYAGHFRRFYRNVFWDGLCDDKTMFYLGEIAIKDGKKNRLLDNGLCLTSTGDLFFITSNAEGVLSKWGVRFVAVGTNIDFFVENCFERDRPVHQCTAIFMLPQEEHHRVYWINRRGRTTKDEMNKTAEFVWWGGGKATTVCDLRRYQKAKVLGISSCAEDASLVILPESIETVWLGMFYECSSLKAVYIPKTVEKLIVQGLPPRRFRNTTVYSGSPIVEAFCKENKVQYQKCEDSEDMLRLYYKASSDDYINIDEAGAIASLAATGSDKSGISGTVWSAVLFSCADKSMATEELQRRYPIVHTCDLPASKPTRNLTVVGSRGDEGEYDKERVRTFVAGLTLFYPLFTGKPEREPKYIYKCPLGDYSLHVSIDCLKVSRLPAPDREYSRDYYINHHIAELVDDGTGRVVHRFEVNERFYSAMKTLYSACVGNKPSSAVLRYAEKLPVTKLGEYGARKDAGVLEFSKELLYSFLPFAYGTKTSKLRLFGVDLYTGELTVLDTDRSYGRGSWRAPESGTTMSLAGIYSLRGVRKLAEGESVADLFGTKCEYEIRRRATQ